VDTEELTALASSAATSLISAMVSDGWVQAKHAMARLWSRIRPGRTHEIADELDSARAELINADRQAEDQLREDLVAEWRSRLRRLLAVDVQSRDELADVMALLQRLAGDQVQAGHQVNFGPVVQTGPGVINQVGVGTLHAVPDPLQRSKPTRPV
jgi:hypothetical protein